MNDVVFESLWKNTPKFSVPSGDNEFFKPDVSHHEQFMLEDLARSGLLPLHVNGYVSAMTKLFDGVSAAYGIPYYDLDGNPIVGEDNYLMMFRTRLKVGEFSKSPRYIQPSSEQLIKLGLPGNVPYIHPLIHSMDGDTILCAEGEKKSVSIIKYLGLPSFGIGGCQSWRSPTDSSSVHPWILRLFEKRGVKKVIIVPDADVFRYDICNAYGTFANALRYAGLTVSVINPPDKIDDLLARWGDDSTTNFLALPEIDSDSLVQSPSSLAKRYNLAHKPAKEGIVVHQHTSNIMKLLEEHPAFPKVWRNLDNNRVMIGESVAQPDLSEMEIANYFQHNLGFDRVVTRTVYYVMQALAKKNQKSPMLEWAKQQNWDKVPRLATWMSRLWGVQDSSYVQEVCIKWLVGACARMHKPGTKVDWMLIVVGAQGAGKTSLPSLMFRGNSLTMYGEQNDKDLHQRLHSALCIGFDELDTFGKRESSFLKAMITTAQDMFRPPYGASVEIFDRRCTLYGSGNRTEFLNKDPSGYRRYAIVEVNQKLEFKKLEEELPQLWAEAWHLYTEGEVKYWEVENASTVAEDYTIPSVLEDKIMQWLSTQITNKATDRIKDGKLLFSMSELLDVLQINIKNPMETREVAAILKGLGCEQKKIRTPAGPRRMYLWTVPTLE